MTLYKLAGNLYLLKSRQSVRINIQYMIMNCSNKYFKISRSGRHGLSRSRIQFTGSSLGILSAYKRRQRAAALVHDLSIISTLVSVFLIFTFFKPHFNFLEC